MEGYIPYMYTASAELNMGNGEDDIISLPESEIKNIVIDYNYDGAYMPVILLTYDLNKQLLNRMVKERHNSTVILDIKKYTIDPKDNEFKPVKKSTYIKDEYIYFLYEDVNYDKEIDHNKLIEDEDNKDIRVEVTIGLLKMESINNNKKTINNVYREVTMTDIILLNTSHMPLLLEPISNEEVFDEILIPPITSISQLIEFLNDNYSLYESNYRYFSEYDKTYLISDRGNLIESSTDDDINNIIINIDSPSNQASKLQGVFIDENAYVIEVASENTKYYEDTKTDSLYNNLICIDSNGEKLELGLDLLNTNKDSSKKDRIVRVENLSKGQMIKDKIQLNTTMLRINTTNIDSSIFTINKKIYVNNYSERKEYNGQFILSEKKEIYAKSGESFLQHIILILKFLKPISEESENLQKETDTD